MPTIYKMARHGELPAVRVGRSWRFSKGVLDEWMEKQATDNLNGDGHDKVAGS